MFSCNFFSVVHNCRELYNTVEQLKDTELTEYTSGEPKLFGQFLDSVMGFSQKE